MSFAQFLVACCLALVLLAVSSTGAAVQGPPLCQTGIVEEMPPHIRKVCQALENSDQLSSALKSYINNEASGKLELNFLNYIPTIRIKMPVISSYFAISHYKYL